MVVVVMFVFSGSAEAFMTSAFHRLTPCFTTLAS